MPRCRHKPRAQGQDLSPGWGACGCRAQASGRFLYSASIQTRSRLESPPRPSRWLGAVPSLRGALCACCHVRPEGVRRGQQTAPVGPSALVALELPSLAFSFSESQCVRAVLGETPEGLSWGAWHPPLPPSPIPRATPG